MPASAIEASFWRAADGGPDPGMRKPPMPLLRLSVLLDRLLGEDPTFHLPPLACILSRLDVQLEQARQVEPERVAPTADEAFRGRGCESHLRNSHGTESPAGRQVTRCTIQDDAAQHEGIQMASLS